MERTTRESNHATDEATTEMDDAALQAAQDAGRTALENIDSDEIDRLLGEIDDVLEENADAFVQKFVQVGGQ